MTRWTYGAAILALATTLAFPASAKLALNGKEEDQKALRAMFAACKEECRAFRLLLDEVERDKKFSVTLNVGRDQKKVAIDAWDSPGKMTVDLTDLEKFPRPKMSGGKWEFPKDVPPWAGTLCEQLAHILAEAYDSAKDGPKADQKKSHKVALETQGKIRECYKQADVPRDGPTEQTNGFSVGVTLYGEHKERLWVKGGKLEKITYDK